MSGQQRETNYLQGNMSCYSCSLYVTDGYVSFRTDLKMILQIEVQWRHHRRILVHFHPPMSRRYLIIILLLKVCLAWQFSLLVWPESELGVSCWICIPFNCRKTEKSKASLILEQRGHITSSIFWYCSYISPVVFWGNSFDVTIVLSSNGAEKGRCRFKLLVACTMMLVIFFTNDSDYIMFLVLPKLQYKW